MKLTWSCMDLFILFFDDIPRQKYICAKRSVYETFLQGTCTLYICIICYVLTCICNKILNSEMNEDVTKGINQWRTYVGLFVRNVLFSFTILEPLFDLLDLCSASVTGDGISEVMFRTIVSQFFWLPWKHRDLLTVIYIDISLHGNYQAYCHPRFWPTAGAFWSDLNGRNLIHKKKERGSKLLL